MQLTIDIPEDLARRIHQQNENLLEIIERGLLNASAMNSQAGKEVIAFLARGPRPEEILAFRPSEDSIRRARELLLRNRQGTLTAEEQHELDLIAHLDQLITLIKAESLQQGGRKHEHLEDQEQDEGQ